MGIRVTRNGAHWYFKNEDTGTKVHAIPQLSNRMMDVYVSIMAPRNGHALGIGGNFDGNRGNDFPHGFHRRHEPRNIDAQSLQIRQNKASQRWFKCDPAQLGMMGTEMRSTMSKLATEARSHLKSSHLMELVSNASDANSSTLQLKAAVAAQEEEEED